MKKAFFLPLLPLLMWSCAQDDAPLMPDSEAPAEAIASHIRSAADVLGIAAKAAEMKAPTSRSGEVRVDAKSLFAIHANDSRSDSSDPLMYAVDFEDNEGFVIISAPKDVEPILFIADEGNYISNETRQNENFQFFLDNAKDYVQATSSYGIGSGITIGKDTLKRLYYYDTLGVADGTFWQVPSVKVSWNQGWPENMFCPGKYAGCGPIAIAQIMSFCKNNTPLTLTYTNHDVSSISLNWDSLLQHKKSSTIYTPSASYIQSHYSECEASTEDHKNLGRLVRETGYRANANYKDSGTSTSTTNVLRTTKNLLPYNSISEYHNYESLNLFNEIASSSTIALVFGIREDDYAGHFWISDAVQQFTYEITYYEMDVMQWRKREIERFIHCNWGWGGNSNGFCLEGIFDPQLVKKDRESRSAFNLSLKFFTISK